MYAKVGGNWETLDNCRYFGQLLATTSGMALFSLTIRLSDGNDAFVKLCVSILCLHSPFHLGNVPSQPAWTRHSSLNLPHKSPLSRNIACYTKLASICNIYHQNGDLHHHVQGPGCTLQSSIAGEAICNYCQPLDGGLAQPLVVVGVWPTEQEEGVGGVNLLLGRIALYAPRARAFKLQRKRGVPGQLYYLDSM